MEGQEQLFSTEKYETGESYESKLYNQIVERGAFAEDFDDAIEKIIAEMVPDVETAWLLIEMIARENGNRFTIDDWGEVLIGNNRLEILRFMLFTQIIENISYLELPAEKWLEGKYPDCRIVDPIGWRDAGVKFDEPISHDRFLELCNESDVIEPNP